MESKYIVVKGVVQGVGFRPYIYNLALENNLKGNVCNSQSGVYINIEGKRESITKFIEDIKLRPPILSKIEELSIKTKELRNYNSFEILASNSKEEANNITLIPSDVAICKECIKDIENPKDSRRYKYPFTNCTNCGPRFSIIKNLPYDRANTSMNNFIMCDDCRKEYENPLSRRFHAQPNCCNKCGPKLSLLNNKGELINCEDEIELSKTLLKEGNILAIKGLGGFHLVCNASDEKSIDNLRIRKKRKTKPLALMMKDINTVEKYCYINLREREILLGSKKPILILKKKEVN